MRDEMYVSDSVRVITHSWPLLMLCCSEKAGALVSLLTILDIWRNLVAIPSSRQCFLYDRAEVSAAGKRSLHHVAGELWKYTCKIKEDLVMQ